MSKQFLLEIVTPDREFFSGLVEELFVDTPTGEMEVMYHTLPMIASVSAGLITIKQNGRKMEAACSNGFIRVGDVVTILLNACKWPYEVNEAETNVEIARLNSIIRNAQSMEEYKSAKAQLAMKFAQLRIKGVDRY